MKKDYWNRTYKQEYYKVAIQIIETLDVKTLLDVGTGPTFYLDMIENMDITALDKENWDTWGDLNKSIKTIVGDFLEVEISGKYDIVSCLQTLEHIPELFKDKFISKLFECAEKYVLISLPYKWESSNAPGHTGIDEDLIYSWFNIVPIQSRIVKEKNGIERIINVYLSS